MAVPTTKTATVGSKSTAADYNTYTRDAIAFLLSPPRCYVYQTATTNMATSGTPAVILFDTEDADTDTMHSTASNTSRMVATTAGRYAINAVISFAANATGVRALEVRKNAAGSAAGGTSMMVGRAQAAATSSTVVEVSFDIVLAATDYLEMFGTQTSGGALATTATIAGTIFQARWVASS